MDVPLVFELDQAEKDTIRGYVLRSFPGWRPSAEFLDAAYRLAERGIPDAITKLVMDELSRCGRGAEVESVKPFVVVGVK
jgi:hypothetical protein